jgi:hypothetical protein
MEASKAFTEAAVWLARSLDVEPSSIKVTGQAQGVGQVY